MSDEGRRERGGGAPEPATTQATAPTAATAIEPPRGGDAFAPAGPRPGPPRPGLGLAIGIALTTIVAGVGFPQALTGRWRAAIGWVLGFVACLIAIAGSVWAVAAVFAIYVPASVDAFVGLRRARRPIRWNGLAAGAVPIALICAALLVRPYIAEFFRIPSSSMAPTLVIGDRLAVDKLTLGWRALDRGEIIVFHHPCDRRSEYLKRVIALGGDTVEIRCDVVYVNGARVASELVDGERCSYDDQVGSDPPSSQPCARYRETLGGHTYDVLHDPDRPRRDAAGVANRAKDFPLDAAPSCGAGFYQPVASERVGEVVTSGPATDPCAPHRHFVVPPGTVFVLGDNRPNSNDSRYWGVVPVENIKGRVRGIWWPPGRAGDVE